MRTYTGACIIADSLIATGLKQTTTHCSLLAVVFRSMPDPEVDGLPVFLELVHCSHRFVRAALPNQVYVVNPHDDVAQIQSPLPSTSRAAGDPVSILSMRNPPASGEVSSPALHANPRAAFFRCSPVTRDARRGRRSTIFKMSRASSWNGVQRAPHRASGLARLSGRRPACP